MISDKLEEALLRGAGALVVEPPLVRRVVKGHRGASGMVPHPRCYAISRSELLSAGLANELGVRFDVLPDPVILVSRVPRQFRDEAADAVVLTRYFRAIVHARIHLALEAKSASGLLDAAAIRQRIDRIGQIEFDEIRALLRHDDLVLPPYDDREVYIEFAALYLELRFFAPGLLVVTFPGIARFDELDAMFAADLDIGALLDDGRPPEVERPTMMPISHTTVVSHSTHAALGISDAALLAPVSRRTATKLLERAAQDRHSGNDVGAALAASRASSVDDPELRKGAERAARDALSGLGTRLTAALRPPAGAGEGRRSDPSWAPLLVILSDCAAAERATRFSVEARLLYALQLAVLAHERPQSAIDLWGHLVSGRRRPMARPLPATRELRIATQFAVAAKLVRHTRIAAADRKLLAKLVDLACSHAEENVRLSLRPRLLAMLDRVGLAASSDPERLAREKLVEELLDGAIEHGYLSFGEVRDALSRNQLKLPDLASAEELWSGDTLLRADRILATELDGAYQPSEIYLRAFQKLSSLPFGTEIGRRITLFFALPFGLAAILLAALEQLLSLFGSAVEALTPVSLILTAGLVFGLIHSALIRRAALQFVEWLGVVLSFVFVQVPRAVFLRPSVRRWFALPEVRFAVRRVLVPALVAGAVWYFLPVRVQDPWLGAAVGLATFLASSVLFDTRLGVVLEDVLFDQLAPGFQAVSRQWLPRLFRSIERFFAKVLDVVDRVIYRVDEALRFREGQSAAMLWTKGLVGVVWAVVAYVLRIYVTLLIEPFVNPLKHFPVVVVADKLMLATMPRILAITTVMFAPLGTILGGFLAWMTMFLSPSIFGFLAWELKENYKLYRATRPDGLQPALIGKHGETMRGLLVTGMHSGTLPKLYERLRRAAQREDDAALLRGKKLRSANLVPLGAFREGLHEVEQGLARFVERELVALLSGALRWTFGEVLVEGVELSSNRIRLRLRCPPLGGDVCELRFEEQSGMIVASIAEPGFVSLLVERSPEGAVLFENALAGLYQRAEVELVREQLEAEVGSSVAYDIADGALVVWPTADYRTELVYRLHRPTPTLSPEVHGESPDAPARVLDARNLLFREQAIQWDAWVSAWSAAAHTSAPIPRLVRGTSLLSNSRSRSSIPPVSMAPAGVGHTQPM
ncbi:MAG: hypothetical protein FJ096_12870 [Deltaproteobacteria bacterium]|nr:hypothetical protein [Deltaproteobacteria bacterium]